MCPTHGCHFKQEFDETLKPGCSYWESYKIPQLSDESKKLVWDWLFTIPADQILIKDNVQMASAIQFAPATQSILFKDFVPGWGKMREEEQQLFEKEYFKNPDAMSHLIEVSKKPKTVKKVIS